MREKKEAFTFIPHDYSEVDKHIQKINKRYGVDVSIIEDVRVYIILDEMLEIAKKNGMSNAEKKIEELIMQNLAHDLSKREYIMLSKKLHDSIVEDGRMSFLDILEEIG